jgi:uncharacterized protein YdhG (YjbR/CyaY superfamily)
MQVDTKQINAYIDALDADRAAVVKKLFNTIKKALPKGFEATISYGMVAFVVPFDLYPKGYHCKPSLQLPFIQLASQKNFIAIYHMGMYAKPDLLDWFVNSYAALGIGKLDIGKSCIRFKKMESIPYDLIAELCSKMSPKDWIACYESAFVNK